MTNATVDSTVVQSAATAYRADEARCGYAPFSSEDGAWIAIATLVTRAAALPRLRSRYLKESIRLAKSLDDQETLQGGPQIESLPNWKPPRSDRSSFYFRAVAERAEESGARWLAACLLDALRSAIPGVSPLELGRSLAQRGRVSWELGEINHAAKFFDETLRLGTRHGIRELEARALIGQGILAQFRGNYPELQRLNQKAVRIAERERLMKLASTAHRGLTVVAGNARDFNTALVHAWRAYESSVESDYQIPAALLNLSQIVLDAGHPEESVAGFTAVLSAHPRPRYLLLALSGLALACGITGDETQVRWAVRQVEAIGAQTIDPYYASLVLEECARAFEQLGDESEAYRLLQIVSRIAHTHQFHEMTYRVALRERAAASAVAPPANLRAVAADIVREVAKLGARSASRSSAIRK